MIGNCIIVHGSPCKDTRRNRDYVSDNVRHWIPWIRGQLEEKDIKISCPLMPTSWMPKYIRWAKHFRKFRINKSTILIGHSAGAAFLVRWLGETNRKVKKLILVAPAKVTGKDLLRLKKFCDFDINKEIKTNIGEVVIFVSDDEDSNIRESVKIYHKKLNARLIELKGKGHFVFEDMGTQEFPELLEEIVKYGS